MKHLADVINPNETEAFKLTGVEVRDLPSAQLAGEKLLAMGAGTAIITLGARGAFVVSKSYTGLVSSFPAKAIDSTGAGDAFTGALGVALAGGEPIQLACRFACAAGALATTKAGAQPSMPRIAEVNELLARYPQE